MSTVNGTHIHWHELYMPRNGQWRHDAILTDGSAPAKGTKTTIQVGGLTLTGKVLRAWDETKGRPHVVSIGGLGWQDPVKSAIAWQTDGGVRLRGVLKTLAQAANEPVEMPDDMVIGEYYELTAGTELEPFSYANALDSLVRDGLLKCWRVDPDGVTRFSPRVPVDVSDRATLIERERIAGGYIYGIDDPKQMLPGNTVDGIVIDRVNFTEVDGKFTARVFEPSSIRDPREQMLSWLRAEFGDRVREYIVEACHPDGRCDLSPPPDVKRYAEIRNVEQWCFGGAVYRAQKGAVCVVAFRDWKKTKPCILGFRLGAGPYVDGTYKGATVEVLIGALMFEGLINGMPATGVLTSPVGKLLGTIATGVPNVGLRSS